MRVAVLPLVLFLGVFSVYLGTAEREHVNVDAYAASAGAWRIATAGTPWFDGLDVKKIGGTHTDGGVNRNGQWIVKAPNGHVAAERMPGPVIAGVPFYWLLDDSGTSESDFHLWPAAVAASIITASAVLLLFLALRRRAGTGIGLIACLVFAFATPTWTISANGLWTHPITQFGIAGAAYCASRNKWWLTGVFLGIGMLGRPHLAVFAAVFGIGLGLSLRDWRVAARIALPTLIALGSVTVWNRVILGVWSISGGYTYATNNVARGFGEGEAAPNALLNYIGFLVSFNRGLLVWTPLLLLFVPAVLRGRSELPPWSFWLAAGGALYTFFQLRLNEFTGGIFFYGYRHGLELITSLVPMLAFSAPFLGRATRRLLPVVVAVQIAAMGLGAMVESFFIPPSLMWRENSFWLAMRSNPELVGGWLILWVVLGLLVTVRYVPMPATTRSEPHAAADSDAAGGSDDVTDPIEVKRASS